MASWTPERRRATWIKSGYSVYYAIFLVFIYGPMIAMFVLSFQGPRGGTSFPMRGFSLHWYNKLIEPSMVGDMQGALGRSLILAIIVMIITALFSTMLAMAFRKRFWGSEVLFYTIMAGLMVPGILLSLGLATLMAVFNRFDSLLEEAARDMGANEWTVFKEITLPLISPGIVAAGLFGFTLSYDEFARTTLLSGEFNTLPLDINASMTQRIRPTLFALGTASTVFSISLIALFVVVYMIIYRRSR